MEQTDDIAGPPLWVIPPSDEEVRAEFIRLSHAQIEELRSIDPETHTGDIQVPITSFPVAEGASPEEVSVQVDKAVTVLESMIAAVEAGKAGQTILVTIYKEGILHGFVLNPENGMTITATAPVNTPNGMDVFRLPIVLGIMRHWVEGQNAVVAWDAVRALNDDLEFPEVNPEV